jgi:hypothetical protein
MIMINLSGSLRTGPGRRQVSLLTQHLPLNSGVSLHPFSRLAMSSPPTTPTVSSATTSSTFSPSATPSQSTDNNGGPSSSLYLYAIQLLQNHKPLPIMFAHFLFLFVISRAHASGVVASCSSPLYVRTYDLTNTGSPSSRRYSYCYSSRPRLYFGLSSSVVGSGDVSKRLSLQASYRLHRMAA